VKSYRAILPDRVPLEAGGRRAAAVYGYRLIVFGLLLLINLAVLAVAVLMAITPYGLSVTAISVVIGIVLLFFWRRNLLKRQQEQLDGLRGELDLDVADTAPRSHSRIGRRAERRPNLKPSSEETPDVGTQRPWLSAQFDDETTRLLCATARLDQAFAREVLDSIAAQPYRAIAPSYGVDLVALARHAARSQRAYFRRNLAHTSLLLVGLITLGTVFLSSRSVVVPLIVGVTAALAWAVQFTDLWIARREALELVERREDPASLAPPIDPDLERRLVKLDRINVVVYDTYQHYPFLGSGWRVGGWAIPPVDITKAPDDYGGKRMTVPFDAVELYDYVAEAVRERGPAGVQVSKRLYVRGPAAPYIRGVLGDRLAIPQPMVDSDVIESALRNPQSAIQAYLCLEKITLGGQLAVSMFVHVALDRNLLTVMADSFLLPSLHRRFRAVLKLPRRRSLILARTVADASSTFVLDSLAAPDAIVHYWLSKAKRRYRLAEDTRRIRRRRGFDYGASSSIREDAADFDETSHVDMAQQERYFRVLQRQVIDAVSDFLDEHNVDISELRKQQSDVISTTSYNFYGAVHEWGNALGGTSAG